MYHLDADGTLIPYLDENHSDSGDYIDGYGQETGSIPSVTSLSGDQYYVARARYLVGTKSHDTDADGGSILNHGFNYLWVDPVLREKIFQVDVMLYFVAGTPRL